MADSEILRPVTISREDLYKRVWETPMSRLANEFGISGNGLAKICDRLNIPYPPRGYWARKEAGQKVVTFRLPARGADTPENVTITPTPPPPQLAPAVQQATDEAKSKAEGIVVPDELKRPHSVIAGWHADLKERRRRERLERSPYGNPTPDWTDSEHRQQRILDTIFRAVERHGVSVKSESRNGFHFEFKSEKIHCRLREKQKQVRRPKTAYELRYSFSGDKSWTQMLEPTGNLVFTLEDYFGTEHGLRREWLETQTKRLEEMVPDIVATLLLAGPALIKIREDREEQQRRHREAERLRQIEQALRKKNKNQWRALVEQAERFDMAAKARAFIAALEQNTIDGHTVIGERSLGEWLVWAKEQLAASDPLTGGPQGVFEEIAKVTDWTYRD